MHLSFKSSSRFTQTLGQIVEGNLLELFKTHRLRLFRDPICTNWDPRAQL